MKILQINKFHYLRGGSERYYLGLIDLLKNNGDEVMEFSMKHESNLPSAYREYFIENVNFQKTSVKDALKFIYNWDAVRKLKKLLDKERPDIAHLHNIAHQLTPQIIEVLKERNIPVVQTLHDYKLICPNYSLYANGKFCNECKGGKYYNCFLSKCMHNSYAKSFLAVVEAYLYKYKKTYDKVDLFIAPSQYMKDMCVDFGIDPNRIRVLNNFIDPEKFRYIEKCETGDYLLYFGRLSWEKGVYTLISAMKELKDEKLKIVGSGPEYQNLKKSIESEGLDDRVELCGPKYGEELKKILNCSKAVILPSIWPENYPYTLLEALSCGKPIIASNTGGIPEIVEDGVSGFLFEPGNSADLAVKINQLKNLDQDKLAKTADMKIGSLNDEFHFEELKNIYRGACS
jgi:glycosyltransferase involved in cell wall biosynthesis